MEQQPETNSNLGPNRLAFRVNEAARVSGLSRSTLYKLMKPGGPLRSTRVGGRRLIPADALHALFSEGAK